MNIQGLKVEKGEYNEMKDATDIIFKGKGVGVRVYRKGNDLSELLLSDKEYDFTLTEHVNNDKWSKSSLKYVWALINKMGNVLMTSKEEEYKILLERYSQGAIEPIPQEDLSSTLAAKHIKYYEILATRVIEDVPIIIIKWWKGIELMSQHELNIFIEGVKSEAKDLNIDISTPSERALYGQHSSI